MVLKSIFLFLVAGLFEIGGGYLVWQWWRNGAGFLIGAVGGLVLILYGIVPTYQPEQFGRVMPPTAAGLSCCQSSGGGGWTISRRTATTSLAPRCAWSASQSLCTRHAKSGVRPVFLDVSLQFSTPLLC
jgi:Uncharacterised BCR, YnfA/UPF0060 family